MNNPLTMLKAQLKPPIFTSHYCIQRKAHELSKDMSHISTILCPWMKHRNPKKKGEKDQCKLFGRHLANERRCTSCIEMFKGRKNNETM